MSNKAKGILLGVVLSLIGMIAFTVIAAFGLLIGILAALIGILFYIGYKKFNNDSNLTLPLGIGVLLIIVETSLSILIIYALYANLDNVSLGTFIGDNQFAFLYDLFLSLGLGLLVFIPYVIYEFRKKSKNNLQQQKVNTNVISNQEQEKNSD